MIVEGDWYYLAMHDGPPLRGSRKRFQDWIVRQAVKGRGADDWLQPPVDAQAAGVVDFL